MRFFLIILLTVISYASYLQASGPSYKFTFGTTLGNFPVEINKMNKKKKNVGGITINTWSLSPNFTALSNDKKTSNIKETQPQESLYIKINLKF